MIQISTEDTQAFLDNFSTIREAMRSNPRRSQSEVLRIMFMQKVIEDTSIGKVVWRQSADGIYTSVINEKTVCLWNPMLGGESRLSISMSDSDSYTITGNLVEALWNKVRNIQESDVERYMRSVVEGEDK